MSRGARAHEAEDLALRSIVLYKMIKAAVTLAVAVALVALWPFGLSHWIARLAEWLRDHFVQDWAVRVAAWLVRNVSRRHIELTIAAMFIDGTLTGIEGWSLARGAWWGPWMVVVATGGPLPFELYAWARHPHVGRAVLFVLNLAIVLFLARHAWRAHRRRAAARR